jgi:hypothetical protein
MIEYLFCTQDGVTMEIPYAEILYEACQHEVEGESRWRHLAPYVASHHGTYESLVASKQAVLSIIISVRTADERAILYGKPPKKADISPLAQQIRAKRKTLQTYLSNTWNKLCRYSFPDNFEKKGKEAESHDKAAEPEQDASVTPPHLSHDALEEVASLFSVNVLSSAKSANVVFVHSYELLSEEEKFFLHALVAKLDESDINGRYFTAMTQLCLIV